MKVFLVGVSCVGKSTIGAELAKKMKYGFYDLDIEVESFYGKSIGEMKTECLTEHTFREKASKVLKKIIDENEVGDMVIVLPPSGLYAHYYKLIKQTGGMVIALHDSPENILARITFYDHHSRRIEKRLTEREKKGYLKEIRSDISYFRRSYKKADHHVELNGLDVKGSVAKIQILLHAVTEAPRKLPDIE